MAYQLPRGGGLLRGSECKQCGASLSLGGGLRGRCPACGEALRLDRWEWPTAAIFAALAWRLDLGVPLLVRSLEAVVLLLVAAIDWRHRLVFSVLVCPAVLVAALLAPLLPGATLLSAAAGVAAGALAFGALYAGGRVLYRGREPMGSGDVLIAALVGAMTGFPLVLGALFIGSLAVAAFGLAAMAAGKAERGSFIPYGPGLCLGGLVSFFAT